MVETLVLPNISRLRVNRLYELLALCQVMVLHINRNNYHVLEKEDVLEMSC